MINVIIKGCWNLSTAQKFSKLGTFLTALLAIESWWRKSYQTIFKILEILSGILSVGGLRTPYAFCTRDCFSFMIFRTFLFLCLQTTPAKRGGVFSLLSVCTQVRTAIARHEHGTPPWDRRGSPAADLFACNANLLVASGVVLSEASARVVDGLIDVARLGVFEDKLRVLKDAGIRRIPLFYLRDYDALGKWAFLRCLSHSRGSCYSRTVTNYCWNPSSVTMCAN